MACISTSNGRICLKLDSFESSFSVESGYELKLLINVDGAPGAEIAFYLHCMTSTETMLDPLMFT